MKAFRQEAGLVAALAGLAVLGWHGLGQGAAALPFATLVYLAWHAVNIARLLRWLKAPRFKPPFSFGVWEHVFDRLQAINLRNRKRKRGLFRLLRQLSLVLGGIDDAVVLFDDRGRVRWFNKAAKRLLGLNRSAASTKPITEIVDHPIVMEAFGGGQASRAAEIVSPSSHAVILRLDVADLEGTGQRLLLARDVTRTHHIEQARRDFVTNVSHELRTPLTVFRGYLEELIDEVGRRSDLAGPVSQLDQQATRMQRLVEDLLDLSRVEFADRSSRSTTIDVPAMIGTVIDDIEGLAERHDQALKADIDDRLGLAGNEAILRMIVSNLIANAVSHAGTGARFTVTWRRRDDEAVFRVSDTGRGIAAEHLPRLTERFYRADRGRSRESGGTGLGLAIVKHGLERHDGTFQIESVPGEGSTFTCRFPADRMVTLPIRPVSSRPLSTRKSRSTHLAAR